MASETDDNTLDNAGPVGRDMADTLSRKVTDAIGNFPASTDQQKAAIARITADNLYDYAEELEAG